MTDQALQFRYSVVIMVGAAIVVILLVLLIVALVKYCLKRKEAAIPSKVLINEKVCSSRP
jgi:heme/copper-type cytochrome/quinol oxidase subunit 2